MFFWFWNKFKTIDELVKYVNTPKRLKWWETFNFHWVSDNEQFGIDFVRSAEKMLKDDKWYGAGDCDDFSLFNFEILSRLGFNAEILNIYSPDNAHSICLFYWAKKRTYWYFSNYDLWNTKMTFEKFTYQKLASINYQDWQSIEKTEDGQIKWEIKRI